MTSQSDTFDFYADAEDAALNALYFHQDDMDAEPLLDRSFADPAPNFILITKIVLEAVGFNSADSEPEIRRSRLTVIDGGGEGGLAVSSLKRLRDPESVDCPHATDGRYQCSRRKDDEI